MAHSNRNRSINLSLCIVIVQLISIQTCPTLAKNLDRNSTDPNYSNRIQRFNETKLPAPDFSSNEEAAEDQMASPSVTSVHQVWTASSSGSLDELSPEMINKLRNDVPFLAAYAIRPRLVGGPLSDLTSGGTHITKLPADITLATSETSKSNRLTPNQLSKRSAKLLSKRTGAKLGDFNELKVETLSSSKSEHTHKKRTTLKRNDREVEMDLKAAKGHKNAKKIESKLAHSKRPKDRRARGSSKRFEATGRGGQSSRLQSNSKVGDGDDVKGGTKRFNKRPFYASGQPKMEAAEPAPGDAPEEEPQPRRVGDDDVEEEGDTVTVMPKFDGVDDDPELPAEEAAADEEDETSGGDGLDEEPRTRRVNRDRPGTGDGGLSSDAGGRSDSGQDSSSTGASGIGTTVSGGDSASPVDGGGVGPSVSLGDSARPSDDDDQDQDREQDLDDHAVRTEKKPKGVTDGQSSVEFANKDSFGDGEGNDNKDNAGFGKRKPNSFPGSPKVDSTSNNDQEIDVDYRDNDDHTSDRRRPVGKNSTSTSLDDDDQHKACDDGSYDHNSDHHHHHNHEGIEWLRGGVPGEPGKDYPILSRANSSNFSCQDQKYPGYYADVESRCQIFHICHMDGQDSFLCPNGTIFSQRSTVCVWWNSFDCEDAPKYYHLNALLYKARANEANSLEGREALDAGGASSMKPRMNEANGSSPSSIDDLINAMMRGSRGPGDIGSINRQDDELAGRKVGSPGPNDEAAIQRKTTDVSSDDEDNDETALNAADSARLRRNRDVPRRKRRASVRHTPPKLKSRRVSRNSRRRKLRHGIKPKRRA